MNLIIIAGNRFRIDRMKHMRRLKAAQANIILSAVPVAKSLDPSAITQHKAATVEK